jgi:ribosomal protein L11 methyltransferase
VAIWLSPKIVLVLSRDDPSLGDGQPHIHITFGNKFGTGTHPTTRLCLSLLEEIFPEGRSVLDLGTGTGILALCAAHLGAGRVIAIDQDFDACAVARHNVRVNGMDGTIDVINGRLEALSPCALFDVALANLELRTLHDIIPRLKAHLRPGGLLVASGVQIPSHPELSRLLIATGFTVLSSRTEGEWVGVLGCAAT